MDQTKIKPQRGYLLVKQLDADPLLPGLEIPESEKDQSCRGEVVAIGGPTSKEIKEYMGCPKSNPDWPEVGEIVIYGRWKGMEIIGEEYKLVAYEDVIAKEFRSIGDEGGNE